MGGCFSYSLIAAYEEALGPGLCLESLLVALQGPPVAPLQPQSPPPQPTIATAAAE